MIFTKFSFIRPKTTVVESSREEEIEFGDNSRQD